MKFCAYDWVTTDGKQRQGPHGRLRLQTGAQTALYIEQEGYEVLAGFGSSFDLRLSGEYSFRYEPETDGAVYSPASNLEYSDPDHQEPFTSADQMPMVTGHVAAVQQSARLAQMQLAGMMREIRAQAAEIKKERAFLEKVKSGSETPIQGEMETVKTDGEAE